MIEQSAQNYPIKPNTAGSSLRRVALSLRIPARVEPETPSLCTRPHARTRSVGQHCLGNGEVYPEVV